jgi:anti-sigma factor RsiW
MEQDRIAEQLWEYIDGNCTPEERERIAGLIAGDAEWQLMYTEITATEHLLRIAAPEQPSMRFTKNIMDAVTASHISTPVSRYISPAVIKGIAAFFGISIALVLAFALLSANWGHTATGLLPVISATATRFKLPAIWHSQTAYVVAFANVILLLIFMDAALRRKNRAAVK